VTPATSAAELVNEVSEPKSGPIVQRWHQIRSAGVDSGGILRFSFGPGAGVPESIISEKPDPDPE